MMNWRECKLGDAPLQIIDGDRGKNYPPQNEFHESGYCLFLNTKNVKKDGFDFTECQFISKERDLLMRKGKMQKNDLALTTRGTIGNLGYFNDAVKYNDIRINSGMLIIRPIIENLCPTFNYYLFRKLQADFQIFISGSAQPQLPIKDLVEMDILLPPLPEQRAIAALLSSFDDKIDLLHRQNKTLEAMAETLFRQWFIEEADEGWEEKSLSEIGSFINGLACQKYPPENDFEKLPVLKIRELSNGISADSDWVTSKVETAYLVDRGDVIFAWSASLLVKIWDGDKCVLNQHLFKVTSQYYPKWFYYLWCKHHLDEFIAIAQTHATTMGHIKRGDLDTAKVLIPAPAILNKMTVQMAPLLDEQISNSKQIRTLEKLRDTLLPKLISGEVRVAL